MSVIEKNRSALAGSILDALERLSERLGIVIARPALRRAVERAASGAEEPRWEEIARRAGREVGLDVRAMELTKQELERESLPPFVSVADGAVLEDRARLREVLADGERLTVVTATPSTGLDPLKSGDDEHASPARRLLALVRLERDDIWVAVVYAAALGVLSLATPLGVQLLVSTVAIGALAQPVVVLTTMLFVGLAFAATLRGLQAWVVERAQQRIFVRTALDFAQRLPHVQRGAFEVEHGPEVVNRFFDVMTVQKGVSSLLVDATALVLQSAVGLVVLSLYHPYLLGLAVVLAIVVGVIVVLGRGGTETAVTESKAKYEVAEWLQEIARHPNVFRSEEGSARANARAEDLTRAWLAQRRAHFRVIFRQIGAALAAQVVGSAALLGVGGWLVVARQLTLGQLVGAELIVTAVLAAVSKLGKYFETYYDLLAALDKLGHVVDLPLERRGGARPARPEGFELVDVATGPLADVSLRVEKGAPVAVLDPDERGSRALVDALTGFTSPERGIVTLGGLDLRDVDLEHLRTTCPVVRGPEMFAGTIRENVAVGRLDVDVRAALEAASVWDAVAALPDGLETEVTTHGAPLPPSVALRVTLARAIAGAPRAIVLDGALDPLAPGERADLVARLEDRVALVVTTRDPALAASFPRPFTSEAGRFVQLDLAS